MKRGDFIRSLAALPLIRPALRLQDLLHLTAGLKFAEERLPAVFVGHGSPQNAFKDNPFTKQLHTIGETLPFKPAAVLVISAHYLTTNESLVKIPAHFDTSYYPVKGATDFQGAMTNIDGLTLDTATDMDHGAWAILRHIFPNRDVPVMELSIPMNVDIRYHWQMAQQLKQLREKGILIVGSGNVVHNLEYSALKMLTFQHKPYSWTIEMDEWIKNNIDNRNISDLFNYPAKGKAAALAINTADHYIPMLYTLSMVNAKENIVHTYEELFAGISMRCFKTA